MSFLSDFFGRQGKRLEEKQTREANLLQTLLEVEQKRQTGRLEIELKRQELEIRRMQFEIENAEKIEAARIRREERDEKVRDQRRELMRLARERNPKNNRSATSTGHTATSGAECAVCKNSSDPRLTVEEVQFHNAGHVHGISAFGN